MDDTTFSLLSRLEKLERLSVRQGGSCVSEEGLIKGLKTLTHLQSLELFNAVAV
jgi:hypothetical protein